MIVFLLHNLCWIIRFSDFVRLVEDTISFIESVSDDSGATVLRTTGLWLVHRLRGRHVPTVVPWRALLPSVLTVRTLFKTLLQIVTTTKPFASYSVVQSLSHLNITKMKIEPKIKIQNKLVSFFIKTYIAFNRMHKIFEVSHRSVLFIVVRFLLKIRVIYWLILNIINLKVKVNLFFSYMNAWELYAFLFAFYRFRDERSEFGSLALENFFGRTFCTTWIIL